MQHILTITGPIYVLIALGWAAVKWGWFSQADMRVVARFVIRLALPALLFNVLSRRPLAEILHPQYLLAYGGGSLLMLVGGWWWAGRFRPGDQPGRVLSGMGMSMCNTGYIGGPVVMQWLGPAVAVPMALTLVVENLLMLPVALAWSDWRSGRSRSFGTALGQALKPLLTNPLVVSIVAGCLCSALQWTLPSALGRAVELLASASAAVALVAIGGALVNLRVQGMVGEVLSVAAGKLLLHPLCVLALVLALEWLLPPMTPLMRTSAVALAAMPMFSIFPILAQRHEQEGRCAAALLVATVASFFSTSAVLWALARWFQPG